MRRPLLVFLVATIGCFSPVSAPAQAGDPDPVFLNAYLSIQQAEKLERDQNFKAALARYRYAGSLYDQINAQHPEWQSQIIAYRRKKTAESIRKLEERIALEPAAGAQVPTMAQLPDPGQLAPATPAHATTAAPPAPSYDGADVVEAAASQIRQQISTLQDQVRQTQSQLANSEKMRIEMSKQLDAALKQIRVGGGADSGELAKKLAEAEETESRLRQQINQLEAQAKALALPDRDADNQRLWVEIEKARTEAAQARTQAERAQANEAELLNRLAHAEARAAQMTEQVNTAVQSQIVELQNALADARADREIAEEQGAIVARKMRQLANRPDVAHELAEVEKKASAIAAENEKLTAAAKAADDKLAELLTQLDASTKEKETLGTKLTEAEQKIRDLENAEQRLVVLAQERDKANRQVEEVTKERDQAREELASAKAQSEEVKKLLATNADLLKQLDASEKTLAGLKESAPEKEKEIADLKSAMARLENELNAAQKESETSREEVTQLQAQLAAASQPPGGNPAQVSEENELLRGIVLRQVREQAQREEARKRIFDELARLQVRSRAINDQVELLSRPVIELSETERALFKTPQLEIVDNEEDAMSFTIVAPELGEKPKEEGLKLGKGGEPLPAIPPAPEGKATPAASGKEVEAKQGDGAAAATPVPPAFAQQAKEAREKFERGLYKEAEAAYEKLVTALPNNLYALSNLGMARYRAGDLGKAEETFKAILKIAPNDAFSHATLGILYHDQSKYDEAIHSLTRSIAANPKNPTAHNFLGVTAAKKGWIDAARKEIRTAIEIDPTYADAHFNLAVVLATAKPADKENARKHYQRAVELGVNPDPNLEELIR